MRKATRAERLELVLQANSAIDGLSRSVMAMVQRQEVDSHAPNSAAALVMLRRICELSDHLHTLTCGDEQVTDDVLHEIRADLGMERTGDHDRPHQKQQRCNERRSSIRGDW